MKAILTYVQRVIASKKDGTICIFIDTGEVATLTVKNRSIVAASLEDSSGKEALESIKLATIIHMEFWMGITQKSDIHKMIKLQAETNALSPIPEDEMHPEGAPLVEDSEHNDSSTLNPAPERGARKTRKQSNEPTHLTEDDVLTLTAALTEYIGPAAGIIFEGIVEQARDMDHLIELLSDELFTEQDRERFSQKAYFLLGNR
jgi:hypothetical protein